MRKFGIVRSVLATVARQLGLNPFRFVREALRVRALIRSFPPAEQPVVDAAHFIVVVTPWLGSTVPWFSTVFGMFLAAKNRRVSFVIDDLPFGLHGLRFRFVVFWIRTVLQPLKGRFAVYRLSDFAPDPGSTAIDEARIARLAELNGVWALRGEGIQDGRKRYVDRSIRQLRQSVPAITRFLEAIKGDAILLPGGVYGSTGLWADGARASAWRVMSFDSAGPGTGMVMIAADGIACQLHDIPRAMALLKKHSVSTEEVQLVKDLAEAEIERRRAGTDHFLSQVRDACDVGAQFDGAVLVALNSSWDSAALGLHAVFESSTQWLVETVRYLLDNTIALVVVRQHPAERLEIGRTTDDYGALLLRHFGRHERLRFIAAAEPLNSYALLDRVSAVAVYTSTIGIEAALRGKAVVTPSLSYYAGMGFVWQATTLAQYQEYLSKAASGALRVTDAMKSEALRCYYLTQCCNWLRSPFSPESFDLWSASNLVDLSGHEKVRLAVRSLAENVPVAYLNHLANCEAHLAQQRVGGVACTQ